MALVEIARSLRNAQIAAMSSIAIGTTASSLKTAVRTHKKELRGRMRGLRWLPGEDAILAEEWSRGNGAMLRAAARLPNRTPLAIQTRANALRISSARDTGSRRDGQGKKVLNAVDLPRSIGGGMPTLPPPASPLPTFIAGVDPGKRGHILKRMLTDVIPRLAREIGVSEAAIIANICALGQAGFKKKEVTPVDPDDLLSPGFAPLRRSKG